MGKTNTTPSTKKGTRAAKNPVQVKKKASVKAQAKPTDEQLDKYADGLQNDPEAKKDLPTDIPTIQEPEATADGTIEIEVNQETLDNNPELKEKGVEVGDTIEIETESITNDAPEEKTAESEESTSKPKLDPAKIAEFEALCLSKRQSRSSIITLAYEYFGGKAHLKDGLNNKEVYFVIGKKRVPEHGIFTIS